MQFEGVLLALNIVLGTVELVTPPASWSIVNLLLSSLTSEFWLFVSEWEQESHQWKWAWARCQVSFPAVFERPTVCDCFRETNVVRRTDTGPSQGSASAVQIALHLDVYQLAGSHGKARCWGVKVSLTIALKLVHPVGVIAWREV